MKTNNYITPESRLLKKSPTLLTLAPFIITLIALFVRVYYLSEIGSHSPYFRSEILVAEVHHEWAKDILAGSTGAYSFEPFIRAPLYPYLLAGLYAIFGADMLIPRLFQLLISAGLTYLIYRTGERVFGTTAGMISALIWAFYGPEIFFAGELFETSLAAAMLFGLFLIWDIAVSKGTIWNFIIAGAVLGLSALMKPNALILLPLLAGYFLLKRKKLNLCWKNLVYFISVCLIVIAPVTIRNYIEGEEFVPIAAYGGLNIFIGNNVDSDGVSAVMPEWIEVESDHKWGRAHHATALTALSVRKASELAGKQLTPAQSSRYWRNQALKFVLNRPAKFISLNLKKIVLFFNGFEYGNTRDLYFGRQYSGLLSILLWDFNGIKFPFGLILPFAGLGIFYAYKLKVQSRDTLAIFLVGAVLSATLIFVCARFRMNAIPFMVIFAGGGFVHLIKGVNRNKAILNSSIIIALLIIGNNNFFKLQKDVSYQEYYNLGRQYLRIGDYQNAFNALYKSFQAKPDFDPAATELGFMLESAGRYEEASRFYSLVSSRNPGDAVALYNLGAAEGKGGYFAEAIEHLSKAVSINGDFWQAWLNLGSSYASTGGLAATDSCYNRALEIDPYNLDIMFNIANLQIMRGDTLTALKQFKAIKEQAPDYPNLSNIIARLKGESIK